MGKEGENAHKWGKHCFSKAVVVEVGSAKDQTFLLLSLRLSLSSQRWLPVCSFLCLYLSLSTLKIVEFLQDPSTQIVLSHILLHMFVGVGLKIGAKWPVTILLKHTGFSICIRD